MAVRFQYRVKPLYVEIRTSNYGGVESKRILVFLGNLDPRSLCSSPKSDKSGC